MNLGTEVARRAVEGEDPNLTVVWLAAEMGRSMADPVIHVAVAVAWTFGSIALVAGETQVWRERLARMALAGDVNATLLDVDLESEAIEPEVPGKEDHYE
jgi:hypothetical protein